MEKAKRARYTLEFKQEVYDWWKRVRLKAAARSPGWWNRLCITG